MKIYFDKGTILPRRGITWTVFTERDTQLLKG